jgi:hypothetical protein
LKPYRLASDIVDIPEKTATAIIRICIVQFIRLVHLMDVIGHLLNEFSKKLKVCRFFVSETAQ